PLFPALDYGADEIIVVLLSPVGHKKHPVPGNFLTAGEHLFEHFLSGSYQTTLMDHGFRSKGSLEGHQPFVKTCRNHPSEKQATLITLAPSTMLGFRSLLNFSKSQAIQLIDEGYATARSQLKTII
ncbi:MAG: patatin-like phospholipase family protein, partial [Deltaproteobacteria bacterium]|nr:patatin-like phospholipase family protein [Deltaproteobacteria bacterium]